MKIKIVLQNHLNFPDAPKEKQFQHWIDMVFVHVEDRVPDQVNEVCIRIVDVEESAHLNETYREKSDPTNVLAFPSEQEADLPNESLGDIAICAELVPEEAMEQGISPENHWAHLTVHAILHLLGYDHVEEQDAIIMETLEIQILQDLGIESPY